VVGVPGTCLKGGELQRCRLVVVEVGGCRMQGGGGCGAAPASAQCARALLHGGRGRRGAGLSGLGWRLPAISASSLRTCWHTPDVPHVLAAFIPHSPV